MDEVTTPEAQPDAVDVTASDGGGTDQADTISLDAINKALGKNYKTLDTALTGLQETNTHVGKLSEVQSLVRQAKEKLGTNDAGVLKALSTLMETPNEPAQPQVPPEGFMTRDQYQEERFFDKNPQLADLHSILKPLKDADASTKSMSWDDFVASDGAKKVIEPYVGYQEAQQKKSVLESSPRLGVATDRLSTARTALNEQRQAEQAGDVYAARQAKDNARSNAVQSVIEAYEL